MESLLLGEEEHLHATITATGERGGITMRTNAPRLVGTYEDYGKRLQILLAGRLAEEIVLNPFPNRAAGPAAIWSRGLVWPWRW
jgi:ATP-dependent Zn protease